MIFNAFLIYMAVFIGLFLPGSSYEGIGYGFTKWTFLLGASLVASVMASEGRGDNLEKRLENVERRGSILINWASRFLEREAKRRAEGTEAHCKDLNCEYNNGSGKCSLNYEGLCVD